MHYRSIRLETLADIHTRLTIAAHCDTGNLSITAGHHPALGNVAIVQTMEDTAELLSQFPADERYPALRGSPARKRRRAHQRDLETVLARLIGSTADPRRAAD